MNVFESGVLACEANRQNKQETGEGSTQSGERRAEGGQEGAERGEQRGGSGERRVESGEWRVESGEWRAEGGGRRAEGGEAALERCGGGPNAPTALDNLAQGRAKRRPGSCALRGDQP